MTLIQSFKPRLFTPFRCFRMHINEVHPPTEEDFKQFYSLVVADDSWTVKYDKNDIVVKTKWTDDSRIKMLKVMAPLPGISVDCLYDVLHDPEYRKVWDKDMTDSFDVCKVNETSVIGWYGAKMPKPLKYRDWSLFRTWRKQEREFIIMNHSVNHRLVPVRKNYCRSVSHLTGYYGERLSPTSCKVVFLTQTDPKGRLPKWFVNYLSTAMAPRIMKKLYKTALKYNDWKSKNNPENKPWLLNKIDLPLHDPKDLIKDVAISDEFDEIDEEEFEDLTPAVRSDDSDD